jgi:hypothetical protein
MEFIREDREDVKRTYSIDIDIERRHIAASAMRELDEMGGVKQDHQAGSGGIIDQDLKIQNLYDLNHARSCYSVYNTKVKCKGACDQRGNEGMRKRGCTIRDEWQGTHL